MYQLKIQYKSFEDDVPNNMSYCASILVVCRDTELELEVLPYIDKEGHLDWNDMRAMVVTHGMRSFEEIVDFLKKKYIPEVRDNIIRKRRELYANSDKLEFVDI